MKKQQKNGKQIDCAADQREWWREEIRLEDFKFEPIHFSCGGIFFDFCSFAEDGKRCKYDNDGICMWWEEKVNAEFRNEPNTREGVPLV